MKGNYSMLKVPTAKEIEISITGGQETHPTAGYRRWGGMAVSTEPIVGMGIIETEHAYSWVRSSNRESSLEMGILFSPYDASGKNISVSFAMGDSVVCDSCTVLSRQTEPNPLPGQYESGAVICFAQIQSERPFVLHALFLAKTDVQFERNGIWHLKPEHVHALDEAWRKAMVFGRNGIIQKETV
jgi:hypothetical protein